MGDLSVSINGRSLPGVELRMVKADLQTQQVQDVLKAQADGLDTIGITIDDRDYLITGKGLEAKPGDAVTIEGQAVCEVAFVEQEENTFDEGFKAGNVPLRGFEGLEQGIMKGMIPLQNGIVRGTVASVKSHFAPNTKLVEQLSVGDPIDRKQIEETAQALIDIFGGE